MTKNGLGNLIALPFQGAAASDGNTVFLDTETGEPFEDQYSVLKNIRRHTVNELGVAYDLATGVPAESLATAKSKKLEVTVDQNITLQKAQLNSVLVGFRNGDYDLN